MIWAGGDAAPVATVTDPAWVVVVVADLTPVLLLVRDGEVPRRPMSRCYLLPLLLSSTEKFLAGLPLPYRIICEYCALHGVAMNMSRSWIRAHAWLLGVLAHVIGRQPREALYPVDCAGRPDLRYYLAPLAHYVGMYEAYLTGLRSTGARQGDGRRLFELRVHAVWGLIARGTDAIDYAETLLRHQEVDAREDGAAILAAVQR